VREYSIKIEHTICIDCDLCVEICPIEVLETHAAE
jgi:Fe-S-cluster-containing hydrogenase component 2